MNAREWATMMARYNAWQNANLYGAADGLTDAARREDRGAFFRSIHGTLSHVLWADHMWLSRLTGREKPDVPQAASGGYNPIWEELIEARDSTDAELSAWAASLTDEAVASDLNWFSGGSQREMSSPMLSIVAHVFNHQTHHRGQVHAMLTASGAMPGPTDLPWMPDV